MSDWLGIIAASGAALGALVYIATWVRKVVRVADKILALTATTATHVGRELTPNSGSSMKDQQTQIPRDVARIERKVDRLGEQLAMVKEVGEANGRQIDAHIDQSALDRENLAAQGIDLPTRGHDT